MGVCCTSVVAAATVHTRARRSRSLTQETLYRCNASSGLIAVTGSSNKKQQQQHQISGPASSQQPNRLFRHRWRRILRFSAVAPNLAAVFRSKLIPEDTNFGRDFHQLLQPPSPERFNFNSKPSWGLKFHPGVFLPQNSTK